MNVYILRHGETLNNLNNITQDVNDDIELTESALTELSDSMYDICRKLNGTAIICSTMLRAKQTAAEISKSLTYASKDHTILFTTDLNEVNFGDFGSKKEGFEINGLTMKDYRNLMVTEHLNLLRKRPWTTKYPNGEAFGQIIERCKNIIKRIELCKTQGYDTVILVGHNRLFRHLLVLLGYWNPSNMFDCKLPHSKLLDITNVCSNLGTGIK